MLYATVRPKLADELKEKGYVPRLAKHPWDENRVRWVFDLDEEGFKFVSAWLENVGQKLFIQRKKYFDRIEYIPEEPCTKRASRISVKEIADRAMPDRPHEDRCDCPACHGKGTIMFTDNNRFYCRKCGRSGTSISFVMLTGLSSEDAAKMICDEFGV